MLAEAPTTVTKSHSGGLEPEFWDVMRQKIRRKMIARGWNQTRLAKESGVSKATISHFMRGGGPPHEETLSKLAEAVQRVKPNPAMAALLRDDASP